MALVEFRFSVRWIYKRETDAETDVKTAAAKQSGQKQSGAKAKITLDTIAARYFEAIKHRVSAQKIKARYEAHIKPILGDREADLIARADLVALYNAKRNENSRTHRARSALKRFVQKAKNGANRSEIAKKIAQKRRQIKRLKTAENEPYSKAFCRSLLDIIGAAYGRELAQETPLTRKNPMAGLYKAHPEIAKLNNEKERTFTKEEATRILQASSSRPFARRFVALAIATGARRGALLRLRRRDFDLAEGTIRLIDEKAESGDLYKENVYTIPLCSYARRELSDFLETLEPHEFVVWGGAKSRYGDAAPNAQMINYYLQPIIDDAVTGNREAKGAARLSLHAFRSFAITTMLDSGCPEFLARCFSNHSTGRRSSFNRYAKTTIELIRPHLERAMAFLRDAIAP
ncbi:MAG: tyrosine-type recombinase/integrase, partial [Helicobacteraceae bacterium]|nr:tyrosine-type recombinase/integrase [Helicobacteraceae bacterium]